ncbi:MAG: hypothetical protein A2725_01690 [Candidatus Magasanikbacteria bacterium RIFCSPHIGHO2_01_FULL_33_34]|uniref:Haloacid dehalogenase n=1 Tax=Candidatus Magasanikbacteria bacterium RIFCSPHIGHO2_01_FULL_33_34 TaxID=1798671 RepID=A0A1F6LJP7_9BACT|nr:MAG: hypothetical protein A2725_01690 [Candidatus Magasanikbacteria bacterium RIFCSPHIGHO2_01_FULL_33_34]OGH65523.1 MAG: hypothetical protein A3B83_01445 [Candidatus Magasanikbacteria bacterium RIFCSPHIGHO2_02_FULL_33_17]OGH76233.1 MAG: hypothetical protein A3A89_02265 [Candidatus Magasanikbacteria bacterium RIFCSPLOWO2_01_FULL_33_34]OGH81639.1 MAG: hypothetical protein A3F93_03660 [Candidatus Magasanikbacteria bacterium RIFCSPLOWO2_12_FULL_34_7]
MIKVAIFDLDSTLIYTQKIKEYIFNFIKQISGESDRFAIQVYNDVRNDAGKITFNLINLKSKLKKSIKNFDENKWKEFEDSFNKVDKSLLIAGAEDLLKFFKGREIPIYILTLGVEDWQKIKIKFSGLEKILGVDFKNLKYTNEEDSKKGKVKEIREILKELNLENCKDILFFNDRPDETKKIMEEFPDLQVFIRREKNDKRHGDNDFIDLARDKNVIKISNDLNLIDDIKKIL